jgi:peroxiredoxin
MRNIVEPLKDLRTTLVALTPQLPEFSAGMVEKHKLNFDMLADPGNAYAAELGIRFDLPDAVREIYLGFGNDLATVNGDDSWTLPMPARIVVDNGGIVRATDIDPRYNTRPEPEKTLEDVRALA